MRARGAPCRSGSLVTLRMIEHPAPETSPIIVGSVAFLVIREKRGSNPGLVRAGNAVKR